MLKIEDAVLVVIDIQGKLATLMHNKEEFYKNVVRMIEGAGVLDIPIIWNEQLPDKLGETLPQIKSALEGAQPLIKKSFSCCGNSSFVTQLKDLKRKQILLVGMETHVCVYQTAQDLLADGFEVFVVADAVSSRSADNKQVGLTVMQDLGARLTCVEMALLEMLQTAEGEKFKKVIQIVK